MQGKGWFRFDCRDSQTVSCPHLNRPCPYLAVAVLADFQKQLTYAAQRKAKVEIIETLCNRIEKN